MNEWKDLFNGRDLTGWEDAKNRHHRTVDADLDDFDTPGKNPNGEKNKFLYAWNTIPRFGHTGLQSHSGLGNVSGVNTRFRNIRLREL